MVLSHIIVINHGSESFLALFGLRNMRGYKSQIFVNGSIVINFTSINGKCKQARTQINTINNPADMNIC